MPEADRDGTVFQLEGPASAPVVVLVGSLGTTMSVWDHQLPALLAWRRVLRVEHPGHGGAEVPEGEGSVEAIGRRVVRLLDRLGFTEVDFAGLSLGGLVGMWLASTYPGRVRCLALCCTAARFAAPEVYLERARQVRASGTAGIVPAVVARWFTDAFLSKNPVVAAEFAAMLQSVDPAGYAYCCEAVASADFYGDLGRVGAPALVLAGGEDPVVTVEMAGATKKALPGSSLVVLAGGAHLANVEVPRAFDDALVPHLVGSAPVRGEKARREVLGDAHVERALAGASEFTQPFQELLARWPWGEVWARPGLAVRERRLVTIGILASLGRLDELEMHVREAVAGGVGEDELQAVLFHVAAYAGVPAANSAFAVADRVVRARRPRAEPRPDLLLDSGGGFPEQRQ